MATKYYELTITKTGEVISSGYSRADLAEDLECEIGSWHDELEKDLRKSDMKIITKLVAEDRPADTIITRDCDYCGEEPATHNDGSDYVCKQCINEFDLNASTL